MIIVKVVTFFMLSMSLPDRIILSFLSLSSIFIEVLNCVVTKQGFIKTFFSKIRKHIMIPYRHVYYLVFNSTLDFPALQLQLHDIANFISCGKHVLFSNVVLVVISLYFVLKRRVAMGVMSMLGNLRGLLCMSSIIVPHFHRSKTKF